MGGDPGTGEDHHVVEQVDALDAEAAQARSEQVSAQVPGGLGKVGVGEAAAGLEHRHALQIEVNRGLYMNEASLAVTPGFGALAEAPPSSLRYWVALLKPG